MNNILSEKVVVTGPESSGKTTLVQGLTTHIRGARGVPEFSRIYLSLISRKYIFEDLQYIAKGQVCLEEAIMAFNPAYLFCDTSLLVMKIWSQVRFGKVDTWVEQEFVSRQYALFVLCKPDIPWKADTQRENPYDRWDLYSLYKNTLSAYNKPFIIVEGPIENRIALVKQALKME